MWKRRVEERLKTLEQEKERRDADRMTKLMMPSMIVPDLIKEERDYLRGANRDLKDKLMASEKFVEARNKELRTRAETETAHNTKRDELYESLRLSNAEKDVFKRCAEGRREEIEQLESELEKWKRGDFIVPANGHNQFDLDEINKLKRKSEKFLGEIHDLKTKCQQWEGWTNDKQEKVHELREKLAASRSSLECLQRNHRRTEEARNNACNEQGRLEKIIDDFRDCDHYKEYEKIIERYSRERKRADTWRDRAIEKRREVTELNKELDAIQRQPSSGTEVHILVYGYKTQFQFQIAGVFSSRDLMYDWIRENPAASGEETETFTYTINKGEL